MFSRPHHQRILKVLSSFVMMLREYRESRDIDFRCASLAGYRTIRNMVFDIGLKGHFRESIQELREVRSDQYAVRSVFEVDGEGISFEIIREGRISLVGEAQLPLPVHTLSRVDLFAEKLNC